MTTLEKLGGNPNQSLHVIDGPIADIQGARNIRMKTVFVNRKEVKTNADIGANNVPMKSQDTRWFSRSVFSELP